MFIVCVRLVLDRKYVQFQISCSSIKDCSTLGGRYRDLQVRVYKQETNFEFLVCKRVLVNPDNART